MLNFNFTKSKENDEIIKNFFQTKQRKSCCQLILCTGRISPSILFSPSDLANSKLGKSVSDIYKAKIRLAEFKAVYRNNQISESDVRNIKR